MKFGNLSNNVRVKRGVPVHAPGKPYAIYGETLRTGPANFSASGETHHDNDLVAIRNAGAAAKFKAHFERVWDDHYVRVRGFA